ncbi:mucin-13 isoform X2 [Pleurodeles waltl]|uniref:mucin-13 isoform X2 n=1 Tax=Pleurodeles waltl TaxID=8319 RepID=UPI003709B914
MKGLIFLPLLFGLFVSTDQSNATSTTEASTSTTASITTSGGAPSSPQTETSETTETFPVTTTQANQSPTSETSTSSGLSGGGSTTPDTTPTVTSGESTLSSNTTSVTTMTSVATSLSPESSSSVTTNATDTSPEVSNTATPHSPMTGLTEPTTAPPDSTSPDLTTGTSLITTTPNATKSDISCNNDPCGTDAATCINIEDGRICQCPYGYYYEENFCFQGKQFFGTVNLNTTYSAELEDPNSAAYKKLYKKVLDSFKMCFENETDYKQTIITKISQYSKSQSFLKAAEDTVIEVNNVFTKNSSITEATVLKTIEHALQEYDLFLNVTTSTPCKSAYCDEATTECESLQNGTFLNCKCKHGFYKQFEESPTCRDCAPDCTEANLKECVQVKQSKGLVPVCQCRADYQLDKDTMKCVQCDFGYSGKDCKDNFLLILVIVGSVLGALLLGLLGGVIGLSVKSKRNNKPSERERLIEHEENPVFGSGTSTNGNLFPKVRAKPTVNMDVATMNPYTSDETFQRSVPTRDYDDDNDSWYEMSPKNNRYGNQPKY